MDTRALGAPPRFSNTPFRPDAFTSSASAVSGRVKFEQRELGNPEYGCHLSPIDFVAFARACGADGFRCSKPSEVAGAVADTLRSPRAALLEAVVDANEAPAKLVS